MLLNLNDTYSIFILPFCPPLKKSAPLKKKKVLLVQLLWKTLWQFLRS